MLNSEQSAEYANPMYLDVEGFNSLRSPSAVDPETRKTVYPLEDIIYDYSQSMLFYLYESTSSSAETAGARVTC